MTIKWCNRKLVESSYCFALCKSQKAFDSELRRMRVPKNQWPDFVTDGKDGTAHYFDGSNGDKIAIVCITNDSKRDKAEVIGLLIHEAVHIWQQIRDDLGEKFPSSEFEAYSIQNISQQLISAYFEK